MNTYRPYLSDLTERALSDVFDRAYCTKSPIIPVLDGYAELLKLATLCRELQRAVGKDKAFICPISVVQRFLHHFVVVLWSMKMHNRVER
jgi:hypothetical protein